MHDQSFAPGGTASGAASHEAYAGAALYDTGRVAAAGAAWASAAGTNSIVAKMIVTMRARMDRVLPLVLGSIEGVELRARVPPGGRLPLLDN
ncbi:hypothetical protein nbrc107697_25610 [Gordonia crocea]|uniref:Uncharacterized protein n=1 Tax=Gordonia crocea TaxID=589162 RepID=A0A7I9V009_9ACTN|nr:hypothetical protein nbrc107697_25610 [Gordonia crocea]